MSDQKINAQYFADRGLRRSSLVAKVEVFDRFAALANEIKTPEGNAIGQATLLEILLDAFDPKKSQDVIDRVISEKVDGRTKEQRQIAAVKHVQGLPPAELKRLMKKAGIK